MKIIEQQQGKSCQCVACNGSDNKMILVQLRFDGAVFLCPSCAQEVGALAEEARERGNER